jgi:hypothetical protein
MAFATERLARDFTEIVGPKGVVAALGRSPLDGPCAIFGG